MGSSSSPRKYLATRQVEPTSKGEDAARLVAAGRCAFGDLLEEHERFERVLRVVGVERLYLEGQRKGVSMNIGGSLAVKLTPNGRRDCRQRDVAHEGMGRADAARPLLDEARHGQGRQVIVEARDIRQKAAQRLEDRPHRR